MASRSRASKNKDNGNVTANVKVAIRVRPATNAEKKEGCVLKEDSFSRQISVKNKSYGPFDHVFNQAATQEEVYDNLVRPQIDHVLKGYSCTLFAYGQTGTGKTFSMEGGSDTAYEGVEWRTDPQLGIIPRAVEHIFQSLENEGIEEYCMRVSYIELYNEELFDLLAANVNDNSRIRLFEDPQKKGGIIISGAEELPVRSRTEVFKLLRRGAERKTMAATMMNHRSSRSHCIFTISIRVRDCSPTGEELMRQGKLNLVDLAGSESIGRSGAEGRRAKEAGNINQSLLTLGRCINALTSNAQHVPFRESKLTRLLQDSLGGSTITTIIATISPSAGSCEETLSTLDYASRAKNIKNHPEANEKLSRKGLMKEYESEIERLQRDLRSAREKNGIHLSQESYEGLEEKLRAQAKSIEDLQDQLQAVLTKVKMFMEDLAMMDEQYRAVFVRKERLEGKLGQRVEELDEQKKLVAESRIRESALRQGLEEMHEIAYKLRQQGVQLQSTAMDAKYDLGCLFEKIFAVKQLTEEKVRAKVDFCEKVDEIAASVTSTSDTHADRFDSASATLSTNTSEFLHSLSAKLDGLQSERQDTTKRLEDIVNTMSASTGEFAGNCTEKRASFMEQVNANVTELRGLIEKEERILTEHRAHVAEALLGLSTDTNCQLKEMVKKLEARLEDQKRQHTEEIEVAQKHLHDSETQLSTLRNLISTMSDSLKCLGNLQQTHYEATVDKLGASLVESETVTSEVVSIVNECGAQVERKCGELVNSITETAEASGKVCVGMAKKCDEISRKATEFDETARSLLEGYNASFGNNEKELREVSTVFADHHQAEVDSIRAESGSAETAFNNTLLEMNTLNDVYVNDMRAAAELLTKSSANHVVDGVQLIEHTGRTPQKRSYDIIDELEFVPKVAKLLKEKGIENQPRRSLYCTRESMLLSTENLMSPQSINKQLATKQMEKIEEGNESAESRRSQDENVPAVDLAADTNC